MSFEHTEEIPQQVKPTIPESLIDRGAQTLLCGDIRARVNDRAVWGGGRVSSTCAGQAAWVLLQLLHVQLGDLGRATQALRAAAALSVKCGD